MKKQGAFLLALLTLSAGAQPVLELWGRNGEKWTPQSLRPADLHAAQLKQRMTAARP